MAYLGVEASPKKAHVRRELLEAHTNASARNPYSIAIVRMIKRMSSHVLGERVGYEGNHVLSVRTVTGLTVVVVK